MSRRTLAVAAIAAASLALPGVAPASGIKFTTGHYIGELENGFGDISFTAKKLPRLTGGRLSFSVPPGSGCPADQGTFSGHYSFKADMNNKGFFNVTASTTTTFGDPLTSTVKGRVRSDGTASGKVIENLEVQATGGVPTPYTCHFEAPWSATLHAG
jgi:hypothetical protein